MAKSTGSTKKQSTAKATVRVKNPTAKAATKKASTTGKKLAAGKLIVEKLAGATAKKPAKAAAKGSVKPARAKAAVKKAGAKFSILDLDYYAPQLRPKIREKLVAKYIGATKPLKAFLEEAGWND